MLLYHRRGAAQLLHGFSVCCYQVQILGQHSRAHWRHTNNANSVVNNVQISNCQAEDHVQGHQTL